MIDGILREFGEMLQIKDLSFEGDSNVQLCFEEEGSLFLEKIDPNNLLCFFLKTVSLADLKLFQSLFEVAALPSPSPLTPILTENNELGLATKMPLESVTVPLLMQLLDHFLAQMKAFG